MPAPTLLAPLADVAPLTLPAVIRRMEARTLLQRLGRRHFGPPSAEMTAALEAIPAIERLGALTERLLDAEGGEDVLAG